MLSLLDRSPAAACRSVQCLDCPVCDLGLCRAAADHRTGLAARRLTWDDGQTIIEEGAPATHAYVVVTGCVKTYKALGDGRRQILGFLRAGDLFGYFGDEYDASAEAVGEVSTCRIALSCLRQVSTAQGRVREELDAMLTREVLAARERLLVLGRMSAEERVASFLLEQAEAAPAGRTIELAMTRTDIGDLLGLRIETVSRVLTALRRSGAVAVDGPFIAVLDRDLLRQAAGADQRAAA